MTTNSKTVAELVSRIERAPNVSLLVDAYDAALGGSDLAVHRHQGRWQIWYGNRSGYCGDFHEIRDHLAAEAEELLDHEAAEQVASAPAMVPTPCQQQQACAASWDEDDIPFPEEGRTELVSASAEDAHITLAGMEAEREGGDRRAAEIAAAAAIRPVGPPSSGLTAAELAEILEEITLSPCSPDEWLAEAAPAARLAEARSTCISAMATVSNLFRQQNAGEDVSDCNLLYNEDHVRRCFDSIRHLERIVELGDTGRWVLFYDRQKDGYDLISADRRQKISLPLTVDRDAVLLAIRIADQSYRLGLSDGRYSLQDA